MRTCNAYVRVYVRACARMRKRTVATRFARATPASRDLQTLPFLDRLRWVLLWVQVVKSVYK